MSIMTQEEKFVRELADTYDAEYQSFEVADRLVQEAA
jgi:ferritin-like metal-binding protein YciE